MKSLEADYSSQFLFPKSLEDFVSADHPARFIREVVEQLSDSGSIELEWREDDGKGRPSYSRWLLLRVWLYAYLNSTVASRRVEAMCRDNVGMMWLAGLRVPDHNSLWRFWSLNKKAIKKIYRQSVKMAWELGLVGLALHAVDGTRLQAQASTRTAWKKRSLNDFLTQLDNKIEQLEREAGKSQPEQSLGLPEELQDARELRTRIQEKLKVLDELGREIHNPNETEAAPMKMASGGTRIGYNAQIVVDEKASVIVAETTLTDPADQGHLMEMMDLVEEEFGRTAAETVADGGYNTEQTLVEAHQKNRAITVAAGPADAESNPDNPYHPSQFTFDGERNIYICPQNRVLGWSGKTKKKHKTVDVYRGLECGSCPVRDQCTPSKRGRAIERSEHHALVEAHRQKRRSTEGQKTIKRRGAIVERPFACIKVGQRFTRFLVRGLEAAAAQWTWICTAWNLKVLYREWVKQRQNARRMALDPLPA